LAAAAGDFLVQAEGYGHPHRHTDIQKGGIPPIHVLEKVAHESQRLHAEDAPFFVRIR